MDLYLKFWDDVANETETRYFSSVFLNSVKAADLKRGLTESLGEDILKKVIQVSMDGPAVNKSLIKSLEKEIASKDPNNPVLLDLGSCGLHSVHGSFKEGMKKTGWSIQEFLICLYRLFKNSPTRRENYTAVTNSNLFPQKFCSIRWVENVQVAKRSVMMLPHLKIWVKHVEKEGPKNPLNVNHKNFQIVSQHVKDKFIDAKLEFFMSVASLVEPFLKEFQSDSSLAPFLYNDITYLITNIMERFVKPQILETSTSIKDINLDDADILIPVRNIDLGFATKACLESLQKKGKKFEEITNFKTYSRQCYLFMTKKLWIVVLLNID